MQGESEGGEGRGSKGAARGGARTSGFISSSTYDLINSLASAKITTTLNDPLPPLSPPHTHRYSTTQSRALPRRTRLLRSRRFHVQSFGHVFQVLIKLDDQNN